jgi:DNA-binding response OmpR family regulator
LPLTEKESQLLRELAEAAPHAMRREQLLAQVWGMNEQVDTHTLETHIYRLRSKLESLVSIPADITTESGTYRLII